ncbi:MAG: hypothetical protein BJ554DRAFT_4389, partial [Olpidium bornovanus]
PAWRGPLPPHSPNANETFPRAPPSAFVWPAPHPYATADSPSLPITHPSALAEHSHGGPSTRSAAAPSSPARKRPAGHSAEAESDSTVSEAADGRARGEQQVSRRFANDEPLVRWDPPCASERECSTKKSGFARKGGGSARKSTRRSNV